MDDISIHIFPNNGYGLQNTPDVTVWKNKIK